MSKERFEVFGNIIKDNEDIPALLNNYQATVRLNELNDKVKELEQELAELKEKAIVPKLKYEDYVYAIYSDKDIFRGQIDVFDYYTNRYFIFFGEDIGSDWFTENLLFATEKEAQDKLKEIQGSIIGEDDE